MRAFVTGASGFVGRRLCARLLDRGHTVDARDRELDVADAALLRAAVRDSRPDLVVHLAAQSSVPGSLEDPHGCFRTNVLGTRNLLGAVASEVPQARVLFVGSGDVYGTRPEGAHPVSEAAPQRPGSPYARSKWAAERWAVDAVRSGLCVVCVRPFNHTGPGQSERFVAPDFARQVAERAARARSGEAVEPMRVGNLASVRDFLHVDDVIDAYLRMLDADVPPGVYNLASGEGRTIRSLLDRLFEFANFEARVETDRERWRATDCLVGDASRFEAITGWRPKRSVDDALLELLEGYGGLATA